jgi:hypothetical protein
MECNASRQALQWIYLGSRRATPDLTMKTNSRRGRQRNDTMWMIYGYSATGNPNRRGDLGTRTALISI